MRLAVYILVCALIFSSLDWSVIYFTRFVRPDLKEWMHANEHAYATITRSLEIVLCAPAMALKPILGHALMKVTATAEQEQAITHAPAPSWAGFYMIFDRAAGYVFIPWAVWFFFWSCAGLLWYAAIVRGFF